MPTLPSVSDQYFPVLVSAWGGGSENYDRNGNRGVLFNWGVESRSRGELFIHRAGTYTVKALLKTDGPADGNTCYSLSANWGEIGELFSGHGSESALTQTIALVGSTTFSLTPAITCTGVLASDLLALEFERNGDNVLDTQSGYIHFVGWLIEEA